MSHTIQHTTQTDEELLLLYRSTADSQWIGLLLQRYTLLLLGVAMKYLKDKAQSEDAVQQVFLKALTHLPEGEILNFKGWLYILMRNHCLQLLRDRHYKADESVLEHVMAEESAKDELLLHEYTLEQMEISLQELIAEQRDCIEFFYLQKMSYQQVMDKTGFSFAQVKSYIQNGKRNLKQILLNKQALRR